MNRMTFWSIPQLQSEVTHRFQLVEVFMATNYERLTGVAPATLHESVAMAEATGFMTVPMMHEWRQLVLTYNAIQHSEFEGSRWRLLRALETAGRLILTQNRQFHAMTPVPRNVTYLHSRDRSRPRGTGEAAL